ncbi:hypothetical protein EDD22DRAFT_993759 [Suillus occidentalis]|nr:hypothetical protein EDD22DRAFT_993759 [Suillus occidentalis]
MEKQRSDGRSSQPSDEELPFLGRMNEGQQGSAALGWTIVAGIVLIIIRWAPVQDPDTGRSPTRAMAILNSFVNDILKRIDHPFATPPSRPFYSLWLLYTVPSLATPSRLFCSLWLLYTVPYCMPTHPSPVLLTMAAVHGPILPALPSFTIPPVLLTMAAVHGPILPALPSFTIPPVLLTMAAIILRDTIPPVLLTMAAVHGPILPALPSFTIPPALLTMAAVRGLRSSFATPSRPFCSLWLLYTVPNCLPIPHHFAPAQSVPPFCSPRLLHTVLYCLPVLHHFAMLRVCPIPEWAIIPHPRSDDSRRYLRATDGHFQWATAILNSFVNNIFERIGLSVNVTGED